VNASFLRFPLHYQSDSYEELIQRYSSQKTNHSIVGVMFYNKINTLLTKEINSIFIELVAPLKVRRFLIKGLSFFKKKKKNIIISIKPKKCFNGCVPPKKIRKRKRKMRILK
jgi:hypothetical protein